MYTEADALQLLTDDHSEDALAVLGLRRSGKTTLVRQYCSHLIGFGVSERQIVYFDFEFSCIECLRNLRGRLCKGVRNYLILDEVQSLACWVDVLNRLLGEFDLKIVITSSSRVPFVSELEKLDRIYKLIEIFPPSFSGLYQASSDAKSAFFEYMQTGGLVAPIVRCNRNLAAIYLSGVLSDIVVKDIVKSNSVRNTTLLRIILGFAVDNMGSTISINRVRDYLRSVGHSTTSETVESYLRMLEQSFVLYRVRRYDIKTRTVLKTNDKYYLGDPGLRMALFGPRAPDYGRMLENVVYLELLRRGYDVQVGKIDNLEVNFIARKRGQVVYYQVAYSMLDSQTAQNKLKSLRRIADFHKRVVLSVEHGDTRDYDGIENLYVVPWLLGQL